MVLYTTEGARHIPKGGIRLSKAEALAYQQNIIRKWNSLREIASLQYGWVPSSAVTFASSVYVTNLIRSVLNVGARGRFITYIAACLIPSGLSGLLTERIVTSNALLMIKGCPMCLHLKFGFYQVLFSVIHPAITSFTFLIPIAYKYSTIALPDMTDARNFYKLYFRLVKSKGLQLQMVAAFQIPLVFLLPYVQAKQMDNINRILKNASSADREEIS